MDLGALHGNVEFADQVKSIVAGKACQIDIFRENKRDKDGHREGYFLARKSGVGRGFLGFFGGLVIFVPCAHLGQDQNGDERGDGEPGDRTLPFWQDNEGGQKGSGGGAGISADLKERLGQTVLAP